MHVTLREGKMLLNVSGALIHHVTHGVKLCVGFVPGRQNGMQKTTAGGSGELSPGPGSAPLTSPVCACSWRVVGPVEPPSLLQSRGCAVLRASIL